MKKGTKVKVINHLNIIALVLILAFTIIVLQGCNKTGLDKQDLKTEYQAIQMINGMYYFGKVENIGSKFIELKDIYLIRTIQNPDTKQSEGKLIAKSRELHKPDRMYISLQQVLTIEPVSPDSKIMQLIKGAKTEPAAPAPTSK
ncbi:MAG: hypothetical protein ABSB79_05055 [Syntrophales bacterium]